MEVKDYGVNKKIAQKQEGMTYSYSNKNQKYEAPSFDRICLRPLK